MLKKALSILVLICFIFSVTISVHASFFGGIDIRSFEDYTEFVASGGLPVTFVPFHAIAQFGVFQRYLSLPVDLLFYNQYSSLLYEVIDENGFRIKINIYLGKSDHWNGDTLPMPSNVTDMRYHPSGHSGTVYRGNIEYIYYSGLLHHIYIFCNGYHIAISDVDGAGLSAYPLYRTDTPLSKLLSANFFTAASVVAELSWKLPGIPDIVIWIGVPVLAAGVTAFFLIRRKKKGTIPPTKVSNDYTEEIIDEN